MGAAIGASFRKIFSHHKNLNWTKRRAELLEHDASSRLQTGLLIILILIGFLFFGASVIIQIISIFYKPQLFLIVLFRTL